MGKKQSKEYAVRCVGFDGKRTVKFYTSLLRASHLINKILSKKKNDWCMVTLEDRQKTMMVMHRTSPNQLMEVENMSKSVFVA